MKRHKMTQKSDKRHKMNESQQKMHKDFHIEAEITTDTNDLRGTTKAQNYEKEAIKLIIHMMMV